MQTPRDKNHPATRAAVRASVACALLAMTWAAGVAHAQVGYGAAGAVPAAQVAPPGRVIAAPATAPIGMVKTLAGQAIMEWSQQRQVVYVGMPVFEGARLVTYAASSVGITFKDETLVAIGPDTHLIIDQYLYAPSQGQVGFMTSLLRGTLNYVSGQIAKLRPESVSVRTPTGTIGVRGTQFVARVDPS